jgi:hypothetical protein
MEQHPVPDLESEVQSPVGTGYPVYVIKPVDIMMEMADTVLLAELVEELLPIMAERRMA